jgi:hypothetical protein
MYKIIWVYQKNGSNAPFFYDSSESTAYKAAITTIEQEPDSVILSREFVIVDDELSNRYLDIVIFESVESYKVFVKKLLLICPDAHIVRNNYILNNNQELLVRIIDGPDEGVLKRIIPWGTNN